MIIYIPTRGRANKQITFQSLPTRWQDQTWFVIAPEEKEAFAWHPRVLVCDLPGVPAARQAALDHADERYVFFFDDDLRFSQRVDDWDHDINSKLRKMEAEDVGAALDWMAEKLDRYAAVGFDARGGNNNRPDRYERIAYRMMRSFGVDRDVLQDERIRFDKFRYWEDFHVTLELLKRGYPNCVSMVHCSDGATNASGGCSLYRNVESLTAVRTEFLAVHGDFCEAVDKPAESWGGALGGVGATVPDLKVYWRKAYDHGLRQGGES